MKIYGLRKVFVISIFVFVSTGWAQSGLSIHGYLTQAYARSDGNTLLGIPEKGTFDYRNLAIQFRYDINDNSNITFQFENHRMAKSPVLSLRDNVMLDWGFYNYQFSDFTNIRVGKILVPFGIYNEIRDVSILLPFYRAPFSPYGEGNYIGETIDGVVFSHAIKNPGSWELEFDLYFGQIEWLDWVINPDIFNPDKINVDVKKASTDNAKGIQIWLNTPLNGLRFGVSAINGVVTQGINFVEDGPLGEQSMTGVLLSADASFNTFFLRSEFSHFFLSKNTIKPISWYVQGGFNLLENLSLNGQIEEFTLSDIELPANLAPPGGEVPDLDYHIEYALGLSYSVLPELVLKAEIHFAKSYLVEDKYIDFFTVKAPKTNYTILSISTSF